MKRFTALVLTFLLLLLCACTQNNWQNMSTNAPIIDNNSQNNVTNSPAVTYAAIPSSTPLPNIEKTYLARVNVSNVLNMRSTPSNSGKILASLPAKAIVQVMYAKDGWCYVYKDKAINKGDFTGFGYCKQDYLQPIDDLDSVYEPLNPVKYTLTDKGYSVKVYRFNVHNDSYTDMYLQDNFYTDMYLYDKNGEFISTVVSEQSSYFFYNENPPAFDSWSEVYLHFLIEDFAGNGNPYLVFQLLREEKYRRFVSEQEIKELQQKEGYQRDYPSAVGDNYADLFVKINGTKYVVEDDPEFDIVLPIGNPFHPLYEGNLDYWLGFYRDKFKN